MCNGRSQCHLAVSLGAGGVYPPTLPCSSSLLHVPALHPCCTSLLLTVATRAVPHRGYPGSTSPWVSRQYTTVGIPAVHTVGILAVHHRGYPSVLYLTVGIPQCYISPWVACRQEVHRRG